MMLEQGDLSEGVEGGRLLMGLAGNEA